MYTHVIQSTVQCHRNCFQHATQNNYEIQTVMMFIYTVCLEQSEMAKMVTNATCKFYFHLTSCFEFINGGVVRMFLLLQQCWIKKYQISNLYRHSLCANHPHVLIKSCSHDFNANTNQNKPCDRMVWGDHEYLWDFFGNL